MTTRPELIENGRLNPGYLKLDLFCRGLRIAPGCRLGGGRQTHQVRAGLGSGLELRLAGTDGLCVNAPINEPFAEESPYVLEGPRGDGRHRLLRDGREVAGVVLPLRPRFYDRRTSSGKTMGSVGCLQGTYLGVYYGMMCANWKRPEEHACRFCALGFNVLDGDERTDKTVDDVVETALAAQAERGISFVHINGGFDDRGGYLERYGPLVEALRERTGLLIGLQIPPLGNPRDYRELKRCGVDNVSLCFELWDPERFHETCPGKHERANLSTYLDAIRTCSWDVGFATTNGELIAGLEDPAASMAAIDWLTDVGAVPTVCVFRPLARTPYADRPPPSTEELVPVFAHLYRRCMERGMPVGIAPDLKVSIVMTPEEGRWLLPPGQRGGWRWKRLRNAALRSVLARRVKRRTRRALESVR